VLLSGKIVSGGLTFDCTIGDLTSAGAKIKPASDLPMPDEFHLIELRSGQAHLCAVSWRRPPWVGVAFQQSFDLRTSASVSLAHMRRLWLNCLANSLATDAGLIGRTRPTPPEPVEEF
jgi:hypothetical protein